MKRKLCVFLASLFFWGTASAYGQQISTLTVLGHGEVAATPDEAVVRLGAVAQAEKAGMAQDQVNAAVQNLLKAIRSLGIAEEKISTVELSLTPVYGSRAQGATGRESEPLVIGYRAGNIVKVKIDDMKILGKVVDAGLAAGANKVEGISFGLKDDGEHRRKALSLAAVDARSKAESIARAMGVQLAGIRSVTEGGVDLVRPQMDAASRLSAMGAAPIQPGQLQIRASLTVSFEIQELKTPATSGSNH